MNRLPLLFLALLLPLWGCDAADPVAPESAGVAIAPGPGAGLILDGREADGNPFFHFQPPIRSGRPYRPAGEIAEDLYPFVVVEVCETEATGCVGSPVASFSADEGDGELRMLGRAQTFTAEWDVAGSGLDPTRTYRIQVRAGDAVLGYADLADIRQIGAAYGDADVLPIRFTVEEGALAAAGGALADADTDVVQLLDGAVRLQLPDGAITGPTVLSVRPLDPAFPLPGGLTPLPGLAFDFGPDGIVFPEPISMTLRFDPAALPAGTDVESLRIHKIVDGAYVLMEGGAVDAAANTVSALVDGFSPFVVLELPSSSGPMLALGDQHSCYLDADGLASCWGWNRAGVLGIGVEGGDYPDPTPVAQGATRFVQLTAGRDVTCGLTAEGQAWCWGEDRYGQMGVGIGDLSAYTSPVPVGGALRFSQLSVGLTVVCGVATTGSAYCWGRNNFGQAGGGTGPDVLAPVEVPGTAGLGLVDVQAGFITSCGRDAAGTVFCWGDRRYFGNGPVTGVAAVPEVAAGGRVFDALGAGALGACGLEASGQVYCWGTHNTWGMLGIGTQSPSDVPLPVAGGGTYRQLSFDARNTSAAGGCAVTTDDRVNCWGKNIERQLGTSTGLCLVSAASEFPCSTVPVEVELATPVSSVAVGLNHACALAVDGGVWCWGDNLNGELGIGSVETSEVPPTRVPGIGP